jgi:2-haloacid dehalogenase
MRYRALLIDFYGTLVAEDDAVIGDIASRIAASAGGAMTDARIRETWGRVFADSCKDSHGIAFRTQRTIEHESLRTVLAECQSPLDPEELSQQLYSYWTAPALINGAGEFLNGVPIPTCLVSNVDTADVLRALDHCGIALHSVVTSEMCRSYKPRPEPFLEALKKLGSSPEDALHVGDSYSADIVGAHRVGIRSAWLNPKGRRLPAGARVEPMDDVRTLSEVLELIK